MNAPPLPYKFVSIEGNIGVGKTTLCNKLHKSYNSELILEEFTDNPFLPHFYVDPGRYAFPVEIFFLTERYKQMESSLMHDQLFVDYFFSDYIFPKTSLFAKGNLNPSEYKLFYQLFKVLDKPLPSPDLIVYLHRSVDKLLELIQVRSREIEKNIQPDYLLKIQNAYYEYFRSITTIPVLVIDIENMDYKKNDAEYQELLRLMSKTYTPGVHRVSMA